MNALETRRAIQRLLHVDDDGKIGTNSLKAFRDLSQVPDNDPWPEVESGMSPRFVFFMDFILDWEGRYYENDPDDPGGETKFGIDKRSHPEVNIKALTEEEAIKIYWKEWLAAGCESRESPYAEVYFNCAVNMGNGRAREFHANAEGNPEKFLTLQEAKYRSIAHNNRSLAKFLKGWLNRTNALRQEIVKINTRQSDPR